MSFTKESKLHTTNLSNPGVLNAEQLKRHKLSPGSLALDGGEVNLKYLNSHGRRTKLKNLIQMMNSYRLAVHSVTETRLAAPLRLSAGYWLDAMSAGSARNRDRAPQTGNIEGQGETDGAPAKGVATTY